MTVKEDNVLLVDDNNTMLVPETTYRGKYLFEIA